MYGRARFSIRAILDLPDPSGVHMEEVYNLWRVYLLDNLQAKLALHEMERVGWNHVIDSPETTSEQRDAAILLRDEAFAQWGRALMELEAISSYL